MNLDWDPGRRLAVETALVAAAAAGCVVAGFRLVDAVGMTTGAWGWVLVTTLVLAWEVRFLWTNRGANRPTDGRTRATFGAANGLTLVRGVLYAGVAGFVAVRPAGVLAWGPAVLYGAGVTLDALDGLVARTLGEPTALGRKLDLAFDTLGFLVAPVVAVVWGQLPVWYLSLSAARYLFKFGVWFRERRGLAVRELPDSRVRRPLAAIQMAFITVALTPVVSPALAGTAAVVVLTPSLAVFLRDYLAVTGRVTGRGGRREEPAD